MLTTTQNVGLKQKIEPVGRLNRNGRYSSTDMLNVNVNVHGRGFQFYVAYVDYVRKIAPEGHMFFF